MIPKVIHYCWFGKKAKSAQTQRFIEGWKALLPDYTFKEWNETNFDVSSFEYTQKAYELGKFAFVSDVCRLQALLEGGIYLDTDVEVLKSFDSFLENNSFIGEEQNGKLLGTAVIGCDANCPWVKEFLALYRNLHFIDNKGRIDFTPNTERITKFVNFFSGEKPMVYPIEYFCAKDYKSGNIQTTSNTVCIHHYAATWVQIPKYRIVEALFWKKIGLRNFNILGKIHWRIVKPILKLFSKSV